MQVLKELTILQITALFLALLLMSFTYWAGNAILEKRPILSLSDEEIIKSAYGFTFGLPFGGPIQEVDFTSCCGGIVITVDNYNPTFEGDTELMFYGGGLYANYNIFTTNNNVVGDAIPFAGLCLESDAECESIDLKDGLITIVGTE